MYNRALIVIFILCIWFVISFVTNILAPMMPIIIDDFNLSLGMAGFLPFSFFSVMGQLVFGLASFVSPLVFVGLKAAMVIVFGLLGNILAISYWAKPLVKNQTIWKPVNLKEEQV